MGKRVRLTDETINSHGSRILTDGIDLGQYNRNPVLLYMHERGRVIGTVKDIKVENGEITAELAFDEASELSRQCKKQWEVGSLRMVSIGIDILEMSEDPEKLMAGQTSPTITKSRLFEVSLVDIGANDNAIVMTRDGRQVTLGKGSENPLPQLNHKSNQSMEKNEFKAIALKLGLAETAEESAILSKIGDLTARQAEIEQLKKDKAALELSQITAAVDAAVKENRLTADKRSHFIELGKTVGIESLKTTLEAMSPTARLSRILDRSKDGQPAVGSQATYKKLSEVPEEELKRMRNEDPDEYRRLYKAEYDMGCEF